MCVWFEYRACGEAVQCVCMCVVGTVCVDKWCSVCVCLCVVSTVCVETQCSVCRRVTWRVTGLLHNPYIAGTSARWCFFLSRFSPFFSFFLFQYFSFAE